MKFRILYAVLVALLLARCATPGPMTKLPQATTVDDYCTHAAGFALKMAKRRDHGDDLAYTKQDVLADMVSLTDPSQMRERAKVLDVLSYVYQNPSRTPEEVRADIYQTCMKERTAEPQTWFH